MSQLTGTVTLLHRLNCGDEQARNVLVNHAAERLRRLASHMLREYPGVKRWEETDDVWNAALSRLYRALETVRPATPLHFQRLAALQVRRVLLDLVDHYLGPEGHGANHHTDEEGKAADDPGGLFSRHAVCSGEPSSPTGWGDFLELLETLPEEAREVVDLLWVQGMKQEEAAELLAVSLRTVKRRLREAKLWLAGCPSQAQ
ncbi:MAG: ECF-type sigma factor [Gemmataceae bacterium]